ncbi:MAG: hypothetical protein II996_06530 [Oscillospiraceae bacterium]|nr:hypothetical protein [Oscillospiraceae bacterium]MBQ4545208.1 hypothetical protein [Oscillospiraceae bacterium]
MKRCGKNLCTRCKTGKALYELDKRETQCPYILCYTGRSCTMFVPLNSIKQKIKEFLTRKKEL